jgi:hypothetical protein
MAYRSTPAFLVKTGTGSSVIAIHLQEECDSPRFRISSDLSRLRRVCDPALHKRSPRVVDGYRRRPRPICRCEQWCGGCYCRGLQVLGKRQALRQRQPKVDAVRRMGRDRGHWLLHEGWSRSFRPRAHADHQHGRTTPPRLDSPAGDMRQREPDRHRRYWASVHGAPSVSRAPSKARAVLFPWTGKIEACNGRRRLGP